MKLNYLLTTLAVGFGVAKADYFKGIERAEIFEKTELNMPSFHIKFSDESYNRFQLTYKCLHDTHPLIENFNEDCYQAPWVNYTEVVSSLISREYLTTTKLSSKQKKLIDDPNLNYSDFKSIVSAASTIPLQEIFSQRHTIVPIPSFEDKKAALDFTVDG